MMKRSKWMWGLKAIVLGSLFVLGMGYLVMGLWNWIMPGLLGFGLLTFWQALGLLLLTRLLLGAWGRRRGWGGGHRWKHRMKAKWERMSPDEQRAFQERMSTYCRPVKETTQTA
jgi:hypothetical protein